MPYSHCRENLENTWNSRTDTRQQLHEAVALPSRESTTISIYRSITMTATGLSTLLRTLALCRGCVQRQRAARPATSVTKNAGRRVAVEALAGDRGAAYRRCLLQGPTARRIGTLRVTPCARSAISATARRSLRA